jgi:hypothetical protein
MKISAPCGGFCAANEGAASDGQSRERRRRQPPKVSGPLAAPARAAIFEGAPMTLRDISIIENLGALRRVLCRERRRRQRWSEPRTKAASAAGSERFPRGPTIHR